MGEAKRRKEAGLFPKGHGPEFKRVVVMLPATFHYNPDTEEVYYPNKDRAAAKIEDDQVLKAVQEAYADKYSKIIRP